jgi:hypothetical protein
MSSSREVELGVVASNMPPKKCRKKKGTGRHTKKRLHIFFNESQKAFLGWKEVQEPRNFSSYEAYIDWCHISKGFPHSCYKLHWVADKANLYHCNWHDFKEHCMETCQHIYNTANVECYKVPFSIARMVYAEMELRKEVD